MGILKLYYTSSWVASSLTKSNIFFIILTQTPKGSSNTFHPHSNPSEYAVPEGVWCFQTTKTPKGLSNPLHPSEYAAPEGVSLPIYKTKTPKGLSPPLQPFGVRSTRRGLVFPNYQNPKRAFEPASPFGVRSTRRGFVTNIQNPERVFRPFRVVEWNLNFPYLSIKNETSTTH